MEKMLIIYHPNKSIAEVQVTSRLCEYQWKHSPPTDEELAPDFIAFRSKLRSIRGVKRVDVGRHDLTIERYEVFDWTDIIPQATAIVSEFTGDKCSTVTDDRRTRSKWDGDEAAYPPKADPS